MFGIERLQAIRELIKEKKSVEVTFLSEALEVSEVTIRRDLDKLEKEGLIAKTYGGAILIEDYKEAMKSNESSTEGNVFFTTIDKNSKAVAQTASKLIMDGDTVFIGGGVLGLALCEALKEKDDVIVVTDNIEVAMLLYKNSDFKVVILGGEVDPQTGNVQEFDLLDELLIEKSFVFVDGVDEQFGYTVNEKSTVKLYKKLKKVSRSMTVVATAEVFNKRGLVKMDGLDGIAHVVTEKTVPENFKSYYYENQITVHTSMLDL